MTSPIEEFLTELGRRGYEPILAAASGTTRFDINRDGRMASWLVAVDRGSVTVTQGTPREGQADAVVEIDGELIDRIATGQENAMAAFLRGALHVEGNPDLLIQLQRTFPGPSRPAISPPPREHHIRRAQTIKRPGGAKAAA